MSRIIELPRRAIDLLHFSTRWKTGQLLATTMKATEVTRRYHDAWNGRDADALLAAFGKDGTFCNPDSYPGVSGESLAAYVTALWTAFPDFQIELLNAGEIEPGLVAHHWRVRALIQARERMVASLLAEASQSRELPSFRLRERRLSRTSAILTGGL